MLLQITGTSGAGKSHLMRSFLAWAEKEFGSPEVQYISGRSAPLGYIIGSKKGLGHNIFVPGHYDAPTGGCDTFKNIEELYGHIQGFADQGLHVVFEGLFVMNQTRGPVLGAKYGRDYVVLQLTTPLAVCFTSINSRRAERGAAELANRQNTEGNYTRAVNFGVQMREAGARVFKVSREEALPKMQELLGAD